MKNANFECRFTVQLISYRNGPKASMETSKAHHDVWHGFAGPLKGDTKPIRPYSKLHDELGDPDVLPSVHAMKW